MEDKRRSVSPCRRSKDKARHAIHNQQEVERKIDRQLRSLDSDKHKYVHTFKNFLPRLPVRGYHTILTSQPVQANLEEALSQNPSSCFCRLARGDDYHDIQGITIPDQWIWEDNGIALFDSKTNQIVCRLDSECIKYRHASKQDLQPWTTSRIRMSRNSLLDRFLHCKGIRSDKLQHAFDDNRQADIASFADRPSILEVYQEIRFLVYIPPTFNKRKADTALELFVLRARHHNFSPWCSTHKSRIKVELGGPEAFLPNANIAGFKISKRPTNGLN